MGENLNKIKQFEEISPGSKNNEYQNSQSIQNTVIWSIMCTGRSSTHLPCYRRKSM